MSYEPRIRIDDDDNVVALNRREAHLTSSVKRRASTQFTSSIISNVRQLHSELNAQHQHEKSALNELNQRFYLFVDRVHQLQVENSKYIAAIAELRRHHSGYTSIDVHTNDSYFAITSNLSAVRGAVIDYHWDFELFQLQATIFKKLIEMEQKHIKGPAVLEDELKQSASALVNLRSAYGDLHRKVDILYAECDDLFKQYLTLTNDWCIAKKQRAKWEMSLQILRNSVVFYKNIRSYAVRGVDASSVTIHTGDVTEYWRAEFSKIIKQVRHDFEVFYSSVYREMVAYYDAKSVEMAETIRQEMQEQSVEVVGFSANYERYQSEYEKIQVTYSHEKEALTRLEASHSKLESEYNSIHLQYDERLQSMNAELYSLQENIMAMAFDVDELRTSKASLESEIIIYRLLLGVELTQHVTVAQPIVVPQPVVVPRPIVVPQPTDTVMMGKISVKKLKKRSIGIGECSPNGKYISLINHSSSKDIDVSRWQIKQHVDSTAKLLYRIPDGVRIARGGELRIYAQSGSNAMNESASYQKLLNEDAISWGMGNSVDTYVFNKNGEEEASYLQTITFG